MEKPFDTMDQSGAKRRNTSQGGLARLAYRRTYAGQASAATDAEGAGQEEEEAAARGGRAWWRTGRRTELDALKGAGFERASTSKGGAAG